MATARQVAPVDLQFRVQVLGPFALRRNGEPVNISKWQRRVETLFKLLVIAPDRRRLRDEVIDLMWPEASPDTATGNLRVVVHRLRAALGGGEPSPVISEHGWVLLNPAYGWDIDLDRFETLMDTADGDVAVLLEAAHLIRGEPLAEDRYDDWAVPVREHVQRTERVLRLQLAAIYRSRAHYDDAAQWFERALGSDPYDEEALRGLLHALILAGKRADAVRSYSRFEHRLREEMDVLPSAETQALVAQIKAGGDADLLLRTGDAQGGLPLPSGRFLGAVPSNTLVGRQEEVGRIHFASDVVESGMGRMLVLAGEEGVGKTRLAQEASIHLRERGFLVATGRCYERDRAGGGASGLRPFMDVLAVAQASAPIDIRQQIPVRWPELARIHAEGDRDRLCLAVSGFLVAVSEIQPVAILLDDLHRADEATIALWTELARGTRTHRVLLLGTYHDTEADREHPLGRALRDLSKEGLVERIALGRLSVEATGALVKATTGDLAEPEDFVDFVYRRTRGNPYFIERLLNALAGRYRLTRQIGAGGMGRVFEAIDTRTEKHVAVKLMFARAEADPQAVRRFEQEGEVLAALRHPNIVRVYSHFVDEHSGAIVMELLSGQPLGRLLREAPMPLVEARALAEQVASALASAHERGIVHRDIKPDNIVVDEARHVKVTDFGIARMVRSHGAKTTLTSSGLTVGTPLYMSPEQIEGRKIDGRADIYSLGAVLYSMVTGRPPLESDDALALAYKQVHEQPEPPSALNPAVPSDWDALILKALAKDPGERFQSAAAMLASIRALSHAEGATIALGSRTGTGSVSGETAPAPHHPTSPPVHARPTARPERRRSITIVAVATALAVLLAAAFVGRAVLTSGPSHGARGPATATSGGARPTAITNLWGASGTDPGQFEAPTGAGTDPQGNVWVADSTNNRVQEFSADGKLLRVLNGNAPGPGHLTDPTDVAIGPGGAIYVANPDPSDGRIDKFSPRLVYLTSFHFVPPGWKGGSALSSVSVDRFGNVYAADYNRNHIRKFAPNGTLLRSWGLKGIGDKRFRSPDGVAVDRRNDVIYVADKLNNRIQKFKLDGTFLLKWGTEGRLPGQFEHPADVDVDVHGNVYVADTLNHRVQEFTPSGRPIAAWGRNGSGYLRFHEPSGVAVGPTGIIYVTDFYNNRVQRILPGTPGRLVPAG